MFITSKEIVTDLAPNLTYLQDIDRGGLKYPSILSINIGICSYQIFQTAVSENFEHKFLTLENQKYAVLHLILEYLENEQCKCDEIVINLIEKSVLTWCNVFLNNY